MTVTSGTILVSPQELQEKAELAYGRIADCSSALDKISRTLAASDSYWQGDAGDAARLVCNAVVQDARDALEELKGYPKDLLAYQGLYSEVIFRTESLANAVSDYTLA